MQYISPTACEIPWQELEKRRNFTKKKYRKESEQHNNTTPSEGYDIHGKILVEDKEKERRKEKGKKKRKKKRKVIVISIMPVENTP